MKIESTILARIAARVRDELAAQMAAVPHAEMVAMAADAPPPDSFADALLTGFGLIAEIKERSPSMGEMRPENVAEAPSAYAASPIVRAVSVLTNQSDFGMTPERLVSAKALIGKPVLRKDFILDPYQLYQARAHNADAVLLMTQLISVGELEDFLGITHELGMEALVECRSEADIAKAPAATRIYGINSRDFLDKGERFDQSRDSRNRSGSTTDYSTDLSAFENIRYLPEKAIKIAESGLTPSTVGEVRRLGYHAALIGTDLLIHESGIAPALAAYEAVL